MLRTGPLFQISLPNASLNNTDSLHQSALRTIGSTSNSSGKLKPIPKKPSPEKVNFGTSPLSKGTPKKNSAGTSPMFPGINRKDASVEDFYCPITQTDELMKDPVVASDGKTYERAAIREWIGLGKQTSPMTNEDLLVYNDGKPVLFSNENLRKIINGWQQGDFRDKACPASYRYMDDNERDLRNIMTRLEIDDDDKKEHFFKHVARYKPKKTRTRRNFMLRRGLKSKRRGGTKTKKI